MPEKDEISTTHARAERHKGDKAARKLESQRQTGGAEKALSSRDRKHDLAKTRNVNKQQREDEEATTRNTQQAEWQQYHRAKEQAAQHDKNTNRRKAKETRARVNSKGQCKKTQTTFTSCRVCTGSREHNAGRSSRCDCNTYRQYQYNVNCQWDSLFLRIKQKARTTYAPALARTGRLTSGLGHATQGQIGDFDTANARHRRPGIRP